MCKRVLQDEVAKRRELEQQLRPIASAFYAYQRSPGEQQIAGVLAGVEGLITELRIRECCYTMPTERHTEVCRG